MHLLLISSLPFPVLVLFILQDPQSILPSNLMVNFAFHFKKIMKNKTPSVSFSLLPHAFSLQIPISILCHLYVL